MESMQNTLSEKMYSPEFDCDWKGYFDRLPPKIKERTAKKMKKILDGLPSRHLCHGLPFLVAEIGQYRITYKSIEEKRARRFYFVGTHDEYLKWIGAQERIFE